MSINNEDGKLWEELPLVTVLHQAQREVCVPSCYV